MNHQKVFEPDGDDYCRVCGLVYRVGHSQPLECPGWPPAPQVMLSEELLTEVLTRITEDLWVNPALVASVTVWRGPEYKELGDTGSIIARMIDDPQATTIVLSGGKTYHVPLPLHEVVALLNGSA